MSTTPPISPMTTSDTGQASQLQEFEALGIEVKADAPRVDEALASILQHRNDPYVEPREHVAALQDEAQSIGYRGADLADGIRRRIDARPLQAVGIAALAGFVYGMIR